MPAVCRAVARMGESMTRRVLTVFPVLALLALAAPAAAQTVDELVAKNVQAKGGRDKLRAGQTIKQTGRLTMQGLEFTQTIYAKRPNLIRQELFMNGQLVVMAFDGRTPWMINPMLGAVTPIAMSGPSADMIRDQSSFDGPLIDYKDKGYLVEVVGLETLGDRKVHHLKLTDKNRQVQHCYLDADTGLEAKLVSQNEMGQTFEQELSDYRDVEGVKIPFSIRMLSNGVAQGQIVVEKVEFNVKIDDMIFRMPR
jgi:outer membrane lipoprotein-sorting protein